VQVRGLIAEDGGRAFLLIGSTVAAGSGRTGRPWTCGTGRERHPVEILDPSARADL